MLMRHSWQNRSVAALLQPRNLVMSATALSLLLAGGCAGGSGGTDLGVPEDQETSREPLRPEVLDVEVEDDPDIAPPPPPSPPPVETQPAEVESPDEPEPPTPEESAEIARLNLESFDLVWSTVKERHYDPGLNGVDWEGARQTYRPQVQEARTVAEARAIMQEMIDLLGQSHMSIIAGEAYEAFTGEEGNRITDDGETGLSVRLSDPAEGTVLVTQVDPGSGAESVGVKTGWEVIRIGDTEVGEIVGTITESLSDRGHGKPETWGSFAVQRRLTGAVGETLPVTFLDGAGGERTLEVPLQTPGGEVTQLGALPPMRVKLQTHRLERDGKTFGYIAFNAFLNPPVVMQEIGDAVRGFMDEVDPVDGVIIDVRGNVGGIVLMCPGIAAWFIDEQGLKLGELTTRSGIIRLVVFPRPQTYDGPVAVLADACSVSAAELLAGGFKSVGRGRVFGQSTAGEALPSNVIRLPNGDGFLFVIADYVTGTGQRLEGDGVEPDEPVAYDRDTLLAGKDPMIEAAIGWIESEPETRPATRPVTRPATTPAEGRDP